MEDVKKLLDVSLDLVTIDYSLPECLGFRASLMDKLDELTASQGVLCAKPITNIRKYFDEANEMPPATLKGQLCGLKPSRNR